MPSINAFLLRTQNPELPALHTKDSSLTYSELKSRVGKTASILKELGISSSENVAVLGKNDTEFIILILAIWQVGAVPVPINLRFTQNEIMELLNFSDCKVLFATSNFSKMDLPVKVYSYPLKIKSGNEYFSSEELSPDKTAAIIFTSGTSGKAKGVELSFNSFLQSAKIGNQLLNYSNDDRWLASLPFYHIGGFSIITRALLYGTSVILPASLNTEGLASALNNFSPTLASFVPTQLKRLIENNITPNEELRHVLLGGGHIEDKLFSSAFFDGWNVTKVYGATETASFVTALTRDEWLDKPKSAGKALLPNLIRIVNESRFQLSPGEIGEVAVFSPALMKGYYKNEEETVKKLSEGFYFSGDLGFLDEDGYLFIEAKRTDLIVTGGENVNPNEVEKILIEHDLIDDAAVFPLKDDEWGEIVAAAIVMKKKSHRLTIDELEEFLKHDLANYKIPQKIFYEKELPRSELGKVLRSKLIDKYSLD